MKNLFNIEMGAYQDTGLSQQLVQQFIAGSKYDVFHDRAIFSVSNQTNSIPSLLVRIKDILSDGRIVMPFGKNNAAITGTRGGEETLIWVCVNEYSTTYRLNIGVNAPYKALNEIMPALYQSFENEKMPLVKWWFQGRHGSVDTKDFYLPKSDLQIRSEYYPDFVDPKKYLDDYMTSNESILLIAGPPGTGKTTLLRYLITQYKLCAHVIYDEKLIENDGPFQSFLFREEEYQGEWGETGPSSRQEDIMVIEDADTILTSRERDGNKLMSRFLNVADGLIKLPNKKLVFTTNILDFGNVDAALQRPGRCFGVIHTRAMNLQEAQAAANVAGLPIPMERREYTIAELFNQGKTQRVRTVGFGVRH
jgi:ABC-type cobalamin/Fe3+-siderophores transport system ATPase subunit